MPIAVVCPSCNAKLKAPDNLIGKTVKCPGCGKPVLVKASAAVAPPRAVAAALKPAPKKQPPPEPEVLDEEPVEDVIDAGDEEGLDGLPKKKKKRPATDRPAKTGDSNDSERTMAMVIHLLTPFVGIVIPLILWIVKRKDSAFIDHHGKTLLSFCVNLFIAVVVLSLVLGILVALGSLISWWVGVIFVILWGLTIIGLSIYAFIMNIVAALKAKKGEWYEYRVLFRLFK